MTKSISEEIYITNLRIHNKEKNTKKYQNWKTYLWQ